MTGEWIFYLIVFVLMVIAVLATVLLGISQANKEGNPGYFKKTDKKMVRLTLFYVVCFGVAILALIVFIYKR
jgi:uncharacterized membrane protein YhaH (DUF805 family)